MNTATKTRRSAEERLAMAEARAKTAEANARAAVFKIREKQAKSVEKRLKRLSFSGSYTASRPTRIRSGPSMLRGSADDHLDPLTHNSLRNIARDLMRNSPLARGMVKRLALCVTGATGIRPQATTKNPEWNKKAEALFFKWARPGGGCDVRRMRSFWQLQGAWLRSVLIDGDGLIVKLANKSLQFVEGSRIGDDYASLASNKKDYVSGVKLDAFGAPVSFKVRKSERAFDSKGGTEEVSAKDVIFLVNPGADSPAATRGEPLLAACADKFNDIDETTDAVVTATRMAAMLALMIKTESPADMQAAMAGELVDSEDGSGTQKEEKWFPGSTMHLKPGESVEQIKPEQPSQQHDPFIRHMVRQIGSDTGMPLEISLLDFSQTNFFGTRAAGVYGWIGVGALQWWMIDSALSPTWEWFIDCSIEDGELEDIEDRHEHKWVPQPMPAIDEQADALAKGLKVALGLNTRKDVIEAGGGDIEEFYEGRKAELEREKKDGFVFAMPQGVTAPPVAADSAGMDAGAGNNDPTAEQTQSALARNLTEMVQKVYLGVGKVISADEAREMLNRAGANLPEGFVPTPAAAPGSFGGGNQTPDPEADPAESEDPNA